MTQFELGKIIRINAYIQRKMGKVTLDGKEVTVVALDGSCVFEDDRQQITLDAAQLDSLFAQTWGLGEQEEITI